jgi:hypothetical protein
MLCTRGHRHILIERKKREEIIRKIREKRWSKKENKSLFIEVLDMKIYLN